MKTDRIKDLENANKHILELLTVLIKDMKQLQSNQLNIFEHLANTGVMIERIN